MSFRIGLVGLCTSHPEKWVPIIRQLTNEGLVDVEVMAAWDGGYTRPEGFTRQFCERFGIARTVENIEDMVDLVDGVIIHTANWDRHIESARIFVDNNKAVFIDKPMVGNFADAQQLIEWAKAGNRIIGGSGLRFAYEVRDYLRKPPAERGELVGVFAGCGTDEFNYGVHSYSLLSGLMGPGISSVKSLEWNRQRLVQVNWLDGKVGIVNIVLGEYIPFHITAVSSIAGGFMQIRIDATRIYRALLEVVLPYLSGKEKDPLFEMKELLEPELAAIAARLSWRQKGRLISLADLKEDEAGYNGDQFEMEYRNMRMKK
jgi:virulence factor